MARRKPEAHVEPRMWNKGQVAARLGKGGSWFDKYYPELQALGFPAKDELFDAWDAHAVERWLDLRHGLDAGKDDYDRQIMEAMG